MNHMKEITTELRIKIMLFNTSYVWPTGEYSTTILTTHGGGNYTRHKNGSWQTLPVSTEWDVSNDTQPGRLGFDQMLLSIDSSIPAINASIVAVDRWDISLPNGRSYTSPVGALGLGPPVPGADFPDGNPSLLEQMKANGTITSRFYGLHMGSALLNQPGSMILGGYEQNRVLGDVGTFDSGVGDQFNAYILDVFLDVEVGASPFNQSTSISL